MQFLSAFISCLTIALHLGGQVSAPPVGPTAWVECQGVHDWNDPDIIQSPINRPSNSTPLVKNAHEPALAEEDSTDAGDRDTLSQVTLDFDSFLAPAVTIPQVPVAFPPSSSSRLRVLRC